MTDLLLPTGKLPVALLRQLLDGHQDVPAELLVPPAIGEDAAVIRVGGGALVAATDPITLTGQEIGGHAVVINANDVAVMGFRPRWFLAVLLLPIGTVSEEVTEIFEDMRATLDRVGAILVGGHTEVTAAVTQPVVVGQMLGFREDGGFIRTADVHAGDAIFQIGPAPIEGAAVLAKEAGQRLGGVTREMLAKARRAIEEPGISVVEPALRAAALGATALHDPTEGGLSAGLYELAEASGLALCVDADAALWFEPGIAVSKSLGADPWGVLASGSLLAAFPSDRADEAQRTLRDEGYLTSVIARAEPGTDIHTSDGQSIPRYQQDEVCRVLSA